MIDPNMPDDDQESAEIQRRLREIEEAEAQRKAENIEFIEFQEELRAQLGQPEAKPRGGARPGAGRKPKSAVAASSHT